MLSTMSVDDNLKELLLISQLLSDEQIFQSLPPEPQQQQQQDTVQQRYVEFSESERAEFVELQRKKTPFVTPIRP